MTKKELTGLLQILMTGTPEQTRAAKKTLEKYFHNDRNAFFRSAYIALDYLPKFDQIKKTGNQAAFVSRLSLFYLVLADEYFNELEKFTLNVLQHPSGTVRQAMLHTADWLYVSLTARIYPFVYPKSKKLTEDQKEKQKKAEYQYLNLVHKLELLIDQYNMEVENVRYVSDMKPSVNKSLQMFWGRLTGSDLYREILEKVRPLPSEIATEKRKIEDELRFLLKVSGSRCNLDHIKGVIFNEDGYDCVNEVIAIFDTGQGKVELPKIMEVFNEAWNYFPHKVLEGLSPAEKALEYQQIQQKPHIA